MQTFTVPASGNYLFVVAGAQGGTLPPPYNDPGGQGATVEATVFLQEGATVPIIVAGQGKSPSSGSEGGGGLSAVYTNGVGVFPTIVAGM